MILWFVSRTLASLWPLYDRRPRRRRRRRRAEQLQVLQRVVVQRRRRRRQAAHQAAPVALQSRAACATRRCSASTSDVCRRRAAWRAPSAVVAMASSARAMPTRRAMRWRSTAAATSAASAPASPAARVAPPAMRATIVSPTFVSMACVVRSPVRLATPAASVSTTCASPDCCARNSPIRRRFASPLRPLSLSQSCRAVVRLSYQRC
jgi:hypothetical protein